MLVRIVLFEVIILNILYISPMKSKVCGYTKNNNDVLIFFVLLFFLRNLSRIMVSFVKT